MRKNIFSSLLLSVLICFGATLSAQTGKVKNKHQSSSHQTKKYTPKTLPGTWTPLKNQPTFVDGVTNQLLLTDGRVLVQHGAAFPDGSANAYPDMWILTPDIYGSYANGTWTQVASLPTMTAEIIGSISGTTLTVTSATTFGAAVLSSSGQTVSGDGVTPGTKILSRINVEADGTGTYKLNNSQTVLAEPLVVSVDYAPFSFASAVLADGRVIFAGGEDNGSDNLQVEESLCAIYDPVSNIWTPVAPPSFFRQYRTKNYALPIGDAASVILSDGTFMLMDALSRQSALLDLTTMSWTETGTATKHDRNNEEGWTLLPNGKVLTVDCYGDLGLYQSIITTDQPGVGPFTAVPARASVFEPFTYPITAPGAIAAPDITACTTLNDLTGHIGVCEWQGQVSQCGTGTPTSKMGAAHATACIVIDEYVTYPFPLGGSGNPFTCMINSEDGASLMAAIQAHPNMQISISQPELTSDTTNSELYDPVTGTWSTAGSTIVQLTDEVFSEVGPAVLRPDGTVFACGGVTGNTAIYDSYNNRWSVGPMFPNVPGEGQLGIADGPGALLPNGNVLVTASPGFVTPPLHVFEFDGKRLVEMQTIPGSENLFSALCGMLVLPTGQIMMTTFSSDVELYTPGDRSYDPDWAPVVNCAPKKVHAGETYKIEGIGFNGMSQGAMYGDDVQSATNYPLVRITNKKSGHVFYCRTHDHSYMGVASDKEVFTYFDVPKNIELGKSKIEVVANGIPSKAYDIVVKSYANSK